MNPLNTKDPYMLLSILNMKLRDRYESLEALCDDFDYSIEEVMGRMDGIGYTYSTTTNQFV